MERFHSTITEIMRIILSKDKDKSSLEAMTDTILTYNNSIHSAIKMTPFELITGHYNEKPPFPIETNVPDSQEYLQDHIHKYNKISRLVYIRNKRIKQEIIDKLNKNRKNPPEYKEGDIIYEQNNRRNKLAPKFSKHIVKQNNKVTKTTDKRKIHKKKIKKPLISG